MAQIRGRAGNRLKYFGLASLILSGVMLMSGSTSYCETEPPARGQASQSDHSERKLSIVPTGRGVTLTGVFDQKAKRMFRVGYPPTAHVEIQVAGHGQASVEPALELQGEQFSVRIPMNDLPPIDALQPVAFVLSFSGIDGVRFDGTKTFTSHIGPESRPGGHADPIAGGENPSAQPRVTDINEFRMTDPNSAGGNPSHGGSSVEIADQSAALHIASIRLKVIVEICAGALAVLIALVVWQILRHETERRRLRMQQAVIESKKLPQPPVVLPSFNGQSVEELRRRVDTLTDSARSMDTQISVLPSAVTRLEGAVASLREHQEKLEERRIADEQVIRTQLRLVLNALETAGSTSGLSEQKGQRGAESHSQAVAAVVNEWFARGGQNRRHLLALTAEVGLTGAHLAEYRDSGARPSGPTPEYLFNKSPDGSWLWTPVINSQDYWAAPADVSFMTMGSVPSLLNKLFDGMQGAGPKFRFEAIYRPCRLRPVAGSQSRFTMVERGVLQLEGSASSSSTNPVSFQSIVQSVRTSAQSTGGEIPVGSSLAGWIKEVTARLETQRFQLDDLFTRPVPSVGQGLESEIQRLQRDLQAIKAAVMRDAKPSNAVRGSPRSLQQVTATAATAGIASPSGLVGLPVLAEPAPEPEIAEGAVLDRLRRHTTQQFRSLNAGRLTRMIWESVATAV